MTTPPEKRTNEEIAIQLWLDINGDFDKQEHATCIELIVEALEQKDREREKARREQIEKLDGLMKKYVLEHTDMHSTRRIIADSMARYLVENLRSQLTPDTESLTPYSMSDFTKDLHHLLYECNFDFHTGTNIGKLIRFITVLEDTKDAEWQQRLDHEIEEKHKAVQEAYIHGVQQKVI